MQSTGTLWYRLTRLKFDLSFFFKEKFGQTQIEKSTFKNKNLFLLKENIV
jgi:hypothetical protein